jgi:aryl-alcohol dehydrogenase-like predicted oxidoreductase
MEYRKYLKEDLKISRLGFGAWPLGNRAYGHTMTEEEGIDLVKKAIDAGINFFDTAPNYALGRSELILGQAIKGMRDKVVINSKFGHHANDDIDFNEDLLIPSLHQSLKRLQTHYIDSIILHNPPMDILKGKTNHFKILDSLKHQSYIHGYGVSIDTYEELEAVLNHVEVDVIELLYNVFFQSTRTLLDQVKEKGIALIIKVPLDSGWLTGAYHQDTVFDGIKMRWTKQDILRRSNLMIQLKKLCKSEDTTAHALGFLWSYEAISTVIPGVRNKEQLDKLLKATSFEFPTHFKSDFEDLYDTYIKVKPLPW